MVRNPLLFFALVIVVALLIQVISISGDNSQAYTRTINQAIVLDITPPFDTIDTGIAECFMDALREAESTGSLLIYRVNSYGGLLDAGFTIGDAVLYSKTPTVAYVETKALSAATLIILPANIIALQRYSTIGDMQPVMVDPLTGQIQFINEPKILNPIIEKAKTYASRSNRNQTIIEEFVTHALTINSSLAIASRVADLEVENFDELLTTLNGAHVRIGDTEYVLNIDRGMMKTFSCSIRSRMISILSNSYIANILTTIGMLATIFALVSGKLAILPLTIGMLLLGLVGTGFSANMVSAFLIMLGALLLALELFVIPGFGVVGVSGIILLTLGFALLPVYVPTGVSPSGEYITVLRLYILVISLFLGGVFGIVIYKVAKVRRKKPVEFLPVSKKGRAIDELKPGSIGFVMVEGEYWRAVSNEYIAPGEEVIVEEMLENGVLRVRKKTDNH
ncbi:NfeD family protein [Desulfurococcus amylolyticus]|uniref:NfeD family protein n=1 Tax=Desulfurococcus amylolyticus TaxID=94694 RepID=UPI0005B200F6|nr:NfeD family protein [Desulfurococcus amylolyticus]